MLEQRPGGRPSVRRFLLMGHHERNISANSTRICRSRRLRVLAQAKMLGEGGTTSPVALPLRLRGGVSLAGAEFGVEKADFSNRNPGVYGQAYQYPQRHTIDYFAAQGLGLLRIPFRWERMQPRLFTPLDPAELTRLREVVRLPAPRARPSCSICTTMVGTGWPRETWRGP